MNARVLSAKDSFVRKALRDFRIFENGKQFIVKICGEGKLPSAQCPASEQKVFLNFLSLQEWKKIRPSLMVRWFFAARVPYLWFSFLPVLFVSVTLRRFDLYSFLFLITSTLLHIGCNLWNDYEDHMRGVDAPESSGGSGVIQKLWIPAVHIRRMAWTFLGAGIVSGLFLLSQLNWETTGSQLFWIGALGALGAASYSGWPFHYKYLGLGEIIVFLMSGPLLVLGIATLLGSQEIKSLLLFSLPIGILAMLRLHIGNIQRIPFDLAANSRTIANQVKFCTAKRIYLALCISLYAFVLFLPLSLTHKFLFLFTLPLFWQQVSLLNKIQGPLDPLTQNLRRMCGFFHILFGIILCLSFL